MSLTQQECDYACLRVLLVDALAEADKGDSIVAIHIETALALLDQQMLRQSSAL